MTTYVAEVTDVVRENFLAESKVKTHCEEVAHTVHKNHRELVGADVGLLIPVGFISSWLLAWALLLAAFANLFSPTLRQSVLGIKSMTSLMILMRALSFILRVSLEFIVFPV